MRLGLGCVLAVAAAACEAGGTPRDASPGFDVVAPPDTGGMDAGPRTCTTDPECDDGFPCTIDQCAVGSVCRYTPVDGMCPSGERCTLSMGCSSGCTTAEDCQDGLFCNGQERCIAGDCFMGDAVDCDDGNACTIDSCDVDRDGCAYEVAAGCDAGLIGVDGGTPCDAFDASTHYSGSFSIFPSQSSSCLAATYSVSELRFSVSGGTLTVTAGSFPLTQTPAPTGPDFDVEYVQSDCNTYRLTGTFDCADRLTAMWRTSPRGSCSICSAQSTMVVGLRR